jgi:transcriptional regulator with XRE-family HTH domain
MVTMCCRSIILLINNMWRASGLAPGGSRCDTGGMRNPEDLRRVGALLRQRREALGLRKSDLARRVGISPAYVTLIEDAIPRSRGNPTQPRYDVLVTWTRALGMDEEMTEEILALAHRSPVSFDAKAPNEPHVAQAPLPWPRRRELVLEQAHEVLRLAEGSLQRDELADLMSALFELIKFRLLREEPS